MAEVAILHPLPGKDQMTCNGLGGESDRVKDKFPDKNSSKKAWSRPESGRHSNGPVRKLATVENDSNQDDLEVYYEDNVVSIIYTRQLMLVCVFHTIKVTDMSFCITIEMGSGAQSWKLASTK